MANIVASERRAVGSLDCVNLSTAGVVGVVPVV
jgi:hypothetical protein